MPTLVVDHHLKDFDSWLEIFMSNPPPEFGNWRLLRGTEDPNRVHVVGEIDESDVEAVKKQLNSDQMKEVFLRVNQASTKPLEFVWLEDVSPG